MAQRKRSARKRSSSYQPQHRKRPAKSRVTPQSSYADGDPAVWNPFRSRALPLLLLVLVTFMAYANAWPDTLVWDDARFALSDRFSGLGLMDVVQFFTEDLWAVEGYDSYLYRPLLLISIMLDVRLLGEWVAGYHLINILLHVLATGLVYGFVRHLLIANGGQSVSSNYAALLAALIFGVHPIHTEVVNSIFNRSELLVSIGVAGGLWWFLMTQEDRPKKAWFGLSLIYLLVLFCRESGAALPALAVAMLWFTLPGSWSLRLRKCIPVVFLLIPLGTYLFLRTAALETPGRAHYDNVLAVGQESQIGHLQEEAPVLIGDTTRPASKQPPKSAEKPGTISRQFGKVFKWTDEVRSFQLNRFSQVIRVWADSLKIIMWPHPLRLFHGGPDSRFWTALVAQLTLLGAALAGYMFKRPGLIIGLSFFYIAMLPSSGFVGVRVYFEVMERNLYLPSVGLTIVLAFGLRWLAQRLNFRAVILSAVILTATLTPITWARNSEWASNISLIEADYSKGVTSFHILQALIDENLNTKNYGRAAEICDSNPEFARESLNVRNLCASAYDLTGRFKEAEQSLLRHVGKKNRGASMIHFTLASMYLRHGRKSEAQEQFEQGIAVENRPSKKEFLIGFMLTELHPYERVKLLEARVHFEKALELQPQFFLARQTLNQLDETLGLTRK